MKVLEFLKKFIIVCFFIVFGTCSSQGQNPTIPDESFGLGTFNAEVMDVEVQADGKILVGGFFGYYKTTPLNRFVRLNTDGTIDQSFQLGTGFNGAVYAIAIQTDGKIIVGGGFSTYNGFIANGCVRLNNDGTIDNSFNIGTGAKYGVSSIAIQSDDKIILGGSFNSFNGVVTKNLVYLNADGSVNKTFNIGIGAESVTCIAIQSDKKVVVGGNFENGLIRLNADGSKDNSFNIGLGVNGRVEAVAIRQDGKIVVGGSFTQFNGVDKNYFTCLNVDGTIDNTFIMGTGFDLYVESIAIQSDGQILVGGVFTHYNGISRNSITRLNTDGTIDNSFNASVLGGNVGCLTIIQNGDIIAGGYFASVNGMQKSNVARIKANGSHDNSFNVSKGLSGPVNAIVTTTNGKVYLGGSFGSYNNSSKNNLLRTNPDGTIDHSFNIGTGFDKTVKTIAIQSDGKIIVGGLFTSYNGQIRNSITRLNIDGSLDNLFHNGTGANGPINSIVIQQDGKILLAGNFTLFDGLNINSIVRLNTDGTIDNSFITGTAANNSINVLAIQKDGKIILGGQFTIFNGVTANRLVRLNENGSIDHLFRIGEGANSQIQTIAVQSDGKIILGGSFTSFNGVNVNCIVRLNTDGESDTLFKGSFEPFDYISTIAIQRDGKILVGGSLSSFNGQEGLYFLTFARLHIDGTLDNSFSYPEGTNDNVNAVAINSDGSIFLGGNFTTYRALAYSFIVRLKGNPDYYNSIKGSVFTDSNNDCKPQSFENRLPSALIKAMPGPFYGRTDLKGEYQILVDSGVVNYILSRELNSIENKLFVNQCATSHSILLKGALTDTSSFDFANLLRECSLLNVAIQSSRMRRCFKSNTFVDYCNYGNKDASSVQLKVIYPSHIVPVSSVPMWTAKQDSVLIYNLSVVPKDFCGHITITDSVKCGNESIRGLTQCIKAILSPTSNCVAQNPAWDRSSMSVRGICANGIARFTITNNGTGNMSGNLAYRVFANDTLIYTNTYKLSSGQSFIVSYPANGKTIRVEADQHPLHPGNSRPRASVEGCFANGQMQGKFTPVITVPQDDVDEEVAVTCNQIIDSYDPNDKLVLPVGVGEHHAINPGEELEYTIRFQNTGTDTAYSVRVVDTLDVALDVASFTEGVSSHPYHLQVSGKGNAVLTFNFDNINLPDSTKNKLASNGLVSFRIRVPESTATGTVIKNKAYIYFDYNSPIITNEIFHTVDPIVPEDFSKGDKVVVNQDVTSIADKLSELVKVYPNPANGKVTVILPEGIGELQMIVYSMDGVTRRSIQLNEITEQKVNLEGLQQGMYIYEFRQNEQRKAGGTLVIY